MSPKLSGSEWVLNKSYTLPFFVTGILRCKSSDLRVLGDDVERPKDHGRAPADPKMSLAPGLEGE